MMDKRNLGDIFGGFGHKHSSAESPFSASTRYVHAATACENIQRLDHMAIHHKNTDNPVIDGKEEKGIKNYWWGAAPVQYHRMYLVGKFIPMGKVDDVGPTTFLLNKRLKVCKKVESKGRTTYSEVADEIIAEFATTHSDTSVSLDEFDEKNIRRRVYDALNVLMALDIITKDKKEIHWKGLPSTNVKDLEESKALHVKLMTRIGKKAAYLKDLEEQIVGLQNLMLRNQQSLKSGNVPSEGFSLPFILVQTSPHSTVEIEISEDMQLVHFDFNSTPFSLHDDAYILKLMRCYQLPQSKNVSQSSFHSSSSSDVASGGTKPFHWNSETDTLK